MTDQTAPTGSYVNDYKPPTDTPLAPDQPLTPTTPPPVQPPVSSQSSQPQNPFASAMAGSGANVFQDSIDPIQPPVEDAELPADNPTLPDLDPVTPDPVQPPGVPPADSTLDFPPPPPVPPLVESPVDSPAPSLEDLPVDEAKPKTLDDLPLDHSTSAPFPPVTETSEKLEDQNIFFMLGVKENDATAVQRESFLDELQQVIWEDFLENDAQLLLTKQETEELKVLTDKTQGKSIEDQEEIVVFLEKLIPDLEEIMLEKALELKSDMVKERIAGMKERFAQEPEKLAKVEEAEKLLASNLWLSLAKALNEIG